MRRIAAGLDHSPSTVARDLKRNGPWSKSYHPVHVDQWEWDGRPQGSPLRGMGCGGRGWVPAPAMTTDGEGMDSCPPRLRGDRLRSGITGVGRATTRVAPTGDGRGKEGRFPNRPYEMVVGRFSGLGVWGGFGGLGGADALFHVDAAEEQGAGDNEEENCCHGSSRVEQGRGEDVEDWAEDG